MAPPVRSERLEMLEWMALLEELAQSAQWAQ
jgi:hypothetical protein